MKLENLKNYLKEKINGWYKNSEISKETVDIIINEKE